MADRYGDESTDFDMDLLSDFLFQADGMPVLVEDSGIHATSTDGTSSSDDAGALPDPPASQSAQKTNGTDRKEKRRAQVAVSARRHRYRKKHEMLDLRKQVTDLSEQLHSLRSKHKLLQPDGRAEEDALVQRHKRRQAEKVNEHLRRALVTQRQFFSSMKSLIVSSPVTNAELNMASLLHSFTRLGRTPHSRRRDYLAMCSDSKADLAVQILLRETEGMNFAGPPSMVTRRVPALSEQQQIVTTVAAYAFDFLDLKTVFASACGAVLGCGTDWPQYTTLSRDGEVLEKPRGNISYAKSGVNYQRNEETVSVESRSLVFYRMGDNYGVLVWDFADQDDLYPVNPETTIKRDLIGAAMIRRELCHDGVERVVYRSICTKLHSFSLPPTAPELSHYLQRSEEGAKQCGLAVFEHIRDHALLSSRVTV